MTVAVNTSTGRQRCRFDPLQQMSRHGCIGIDEFIRHEGVLQDELLRLDAEPLRSELRSMLEASAAPDAMNARQRAAEHAQVLFGFEIRGVAALARKQREAVAFVYQQRLSRLRL